MALVIPPNIWEPATPGIVSLAENRSPALLMQVINQWGVETHVRYAPNRNTTKDYTFLWDVTRAMNAEIPHWSSPIDGSPVMPGLGTENKANGICDWLAQWGPSFGWYPCSLAEALLAALAGCCAVAGWKNPQGNPGHVAIFTPSTSGPRIAQAGIRNFVDLPMALGFGQLPVVLYQHR